ncbi:hypothetical protein B296_00014276 [Ensete ventricosum]|uniref:Uncharacterized protein n=1 Tax=Ensete ventricosum TaxID=4639 RepID=A0A426ZTR0_ENSVE|nr:hypothetical protein B296_00014276 [Ensete ventricosum]
MWDRYRNFIRVWRAASDLLPMDSWATSDLSPQAYLILPVSSSVSSLHTTSAPFEEPNGARERRRKQDEEKKDDSDARREK